MSLGMDLELKHFAGQPWSVLTNYLGFGSSSDLDDDDEFYDDSPMEISGTMRLNKSDMGIYGQYPGTETFELAVCEFCGDKFKLAAMAEHIGLRHDDMEIPASDVSNVPSKTKMLQMNLQKKDKSPRNTTPEKDSSPEMQFALPVTPKVKTKIPEEKGKILFSQDPPKLEEVKALPQPSIPCASKQEKPEPPSLTSLLKRDPAKLKQLKLKLKKSKETCNQVHKPVVSNKILKNDGWVHVNSANLKIKEKIKTENGFKKAVIKSEPSPPQQQESSDDLSKMQPVVQLSPLDYSQSPVKVQPGQNQEAKRKVKKVVKDRTYNPDQHCGVAGKENAKPCTRSLTCKSHSMSLRRAVRGRSKAFDVLLADHRAEKEREIYERKIMGSRSVIETQFSSGGNSQNSSNGVMLATSPKFQSSNDEKGKGTLVMGTGAVNAMKIHGASSILKKQILNPLLARQDTINGAVLKNVSHAPFQIQPSPRVLAPKPAPIQVEVLRQWHPGFRRSGGLLYTNNQMLKASGTRPIAPKPDNQKLTNVIDSVKELSQQMLTVVQTKSSSNLVMGSPQSEIVKRIPLTLGPGKKKAVATLIPKQATSLLMPMNLNGKSLLNNQQQKLAAVVQVPRNGFICSPNQPGKWKFDEANINNLTKKLKKDGKFEVGPIITSSGVSPVMRFSIANGILEKSVVTNSSVPFSASRQFQPGVSLLQNNGIGISSPQRVHYVTSTGPLPVTLQQLPVNPQMQLKPEVKTRNAPKLKLITPDGVMVFIQKDQQ